MNVEYYVSEVLYNHSIIPSRQFSRQHCKRTTVNNSAHVERNGKLLWESYSNRIDEWMNGYSDESIPIKIYKRRDHDEDEIETYWAYLLIRVRLIIAQHDGITSTVLSAWLRTKVLVIFSMPENIQRTIPTRNRRTDTELRHRTHRRTNRQTARHRKLRGTNRQTDRGKTPTTKLNVYLTSPPSR